MTFPVSLDIMVQPAATDTLPRATAAVRAAVTGTLAVSLAIETNVTSASLANNASAPFFRLRLSAPRLSLDDALLEISTTADFVDTASVSFSEKVIAHLGLSSTATLVWPVPRALYDGLPSNTSVTVASDELATAAAGGITAGGRLSLRLEPVEWSPVTPFALVGVPLASLSTALATAAVFAPSFRIAGTLPSAATAGFRALLARLFASAMLLPEPPQRTGVTALDTFSPQSAFTELSAAVDTALATAEATSVGWSAALCAARQLGAVNVSFPTCEFALDATGILSLHLALRLEQTVDASSLLRHELVAATAQAAAAGILPTDTSIAASDTMEDESLPDITAQQRLDLAFALSLDLGEDAAAANAGQSTFTLVSVALATRLAVQGGSVKLGPLTFDALGVSLVASASVTPSADNDPALVALRRTSLRILNSQLATSLSNLFLAQQTAVFAGQVRLAARISADGFAVTLPAPDALLTYTDAALFDGMAGAAAADVNLDTAALTALLTQPADFLTQIVRDSNASEAYGLPGVLSGLTALLSLPVAEIAEEATALFGLVAAPAAGLSATAFETSFGVRGADSGALFPALARLLAVSNANLAGAALLASPLRLINADGSTLLWEGGLASHMAAALSIPDVLFAACISSHGAADGMSELRCLLQAALPPTLCSRAALAYAWQRLRAGAEGLLSEGASVFSGLTQGALGVPNANLAGISLDSDNGGPLGVGQIGFGDVMVSYTAATGVTTVALRFAGRIQSDAAAAALSAVELATEAASSILSEAGSSSFVGTRLGDDKVLGLPSNLSVPSSPSVTLTSAFDLTLHVAVQLGGDGAPTSSVSLNALQATLALDVTLTQPLRATLGDDVLVELDDVSVRVSGGLTLPAGSAPATDLRNATRIAAVDATATLRLQESAVPDVVFALADDNVLDSVPLMLTVDLILDSQDFDMVLQGLRALESVNAFIFDNDELDFVLPLLKTRLIDLLNTEPTDIEPDVTVPDVPGSTAPPPSPPPPPPSSGLPALLALATPADSYRTACSDSCTARGLAGVLRQHVLTSINGTVLPAVAGRTPVTVLSGLTGDNAFTFMVDISVARNRMTTLDWSSEIDLPGLSTGDLEVAMTASVALSINLTIDFEEQSLTLTMPNFAVALALDTSIDFSVSLGLVDAVLLPTSGLTTAVSFSTFFPAATLTLNTGASLTNALETPELIGSLSVVLDVEGRLLQEPVARGTARLESSDLFDPSAMTFSLDGMGELLALASLDPFFLLNVIRSWARSTELQVDFLSFRVPGLDATAGELLLGDGTDAFVASFAEASEQPTPVSDRETLELVLAGRPVAGSFDDIVALAASLAPTVDSGDVQLALAVNDADFVAVPINQATVLLATDLDQLVDAVNAALATTALSGLVFARAATDTEAGMVALDFYTAAELAATRFTVSVLVVEATDPNRRRRETLDGRGYYFPDHAPRATRRDTARRRFMAHTATATLRDSACLFVSASPSVNSSVVEQTHYLDHGHPAFPRRRQPRGMRLTRDMQTHYAAARTHRRRRLVGPAAVHTRSRRHRLAQERGKHRRSYGPLNIPGADTFQEAAAAMHAHYAADDRSRRAEGDAEGVPEAYFGLADGDEEVVEGVARASRVEHLVQLVNDVLGLPAGTLGIIVGTDPTTELRRVLLQVTLTETTRLDASLRVEEEWAPLAEFVLHGSASLEASVEAVLRMGVLLGRPADERIHVTLRLGADSGPDGSCGGTNTTYVVCADIHVRLRYGLAQSDVATLTLSAGSASVAAASAALRTAGIAESTVKAEGIDADPAVVLFTSTTSQLLRLALLEPVPAVDITVDTADGDASFVMPYFDAATVTARLAGAVAATASGAIGSLVGLDVRDVSGEVTIAAALGFKTPPSSRFAASAEQTAVTVGELLTVLADKTTLLDAVQGAVSLSGDLSLADVQVSPIGLGLPFEMSAILDIIELTLADVSNGQLPDGVNYTLSGPVDMLSLSSVSPELIAQALRALAVYLQDTLSGSALSTEVPYTGISLDDLLGGFVTLVDQLLAAAANPGERLAALELSLEAALGLTPAAGDAARNCTGSCFLEFAITPTPTDACPDAITLRLSLEYTATTSKSAMFNLQLGSMLAEEIDNDAVAAAIERLVDLDASATLSVGVSASARLDVGITLNPDSASASNVEVFLSAGSGIVLRATMSVTELNVRAALGPISAALVDGMTTVDIAAIATVGGSSSGDSVYYLLPRSGSPLCAAATPLQSFATPFIEGTLAASLPLELSAGGDPVRAAIDFSGVFRLDGSTALSIPASSITQVKDAVLALLKDNPIDGLLADGELFRSGLGLAFDALEDLLVSTLSGVKLPLIGNGLGRAVDGLLTQLRASIIDALITAMTDPGTGSFDLVDSMRQALVDVLNNNGLLPDGLGVDVFFVDRALTRLDDSVGADGIAFGLIFGREQVEILPLDFDLGVPGFEFKFASTAQVELTFSWMLQLQLVYSKSRGFGLLSLKPEGPEFSITATAIVVPEPGAESLATGRIFVLNVLADMVDGEPTGISVSAGLGLIGDGVDGIGLVSLGRLLSGKALFFTMGADAEINVALSAGVGSGRQANFVSFGLTLSAGLGFVFDSASGNGLVLSPPRLQFLDVALDLRTLFQNLANGLLARTSEVLEPLQSVIAQLQQEVPIVSDFVRPVNYVELGVLLCQIYPSCRIGKIDFKPFFAALSQVLKLLGVVSSALDAAADGSFGLLTIGSFSLERDPVAGNYGFQRIDDLRRSTDTGDMVNCNQDSAGAAARSGLQLMCAAKQAVSFPILSISGAMEYLLGGNPDIVLVELPDFELNWSTEIRIPIVSPFLNAVLGFGLNVKAGLTAGLNARGVRAALAQSAPLLVLTKGLFFDTTRPLISGSISISVGGEANFGFVKASASGTITISTDLLWNDFDVDGRLYVEELILLLRLQPVFGIFSVRFRVGISFGFKVRIKLFFRKKTVFSLFVSTVLVDQTVRGVVPPAVGTARGGVLTLSTSGINSFASRLGFSASERAVRLAATAGQAGSESIDVSLGSPTAAASDLLTTPFGSISTLATPDLSSYVLSFNSILSAIVAGVAQATTVDLSPLTVASVELYATADGTLLLGDGISPEGQFFPGSFTLILDSGANVVTVYGCGGGGDIFLVLSGGDDVLQAKQVQSSEAPLSTLGCNLVVDGGEGINEVLAAFDNSVTRASLVLDTDTDAGTDSLMPLAGNFEITYTSFASTSLLLTAAQGDSVLVNGLTSKLEVDQDAGSATVTLIAAGLASDADVVNTKGAAMRLVLIAAENSPAVEVGTAASLRTVSNLSPTGGAVTHSGLTELNVQLTGAGQSQVSVPGTARAEDSALGFVTRLLGSPGDNTFIVAGVTDAGARTLQSRVEIYGGSSANDVLRLSYGNLRHGGVSVVNIETLDLTGAGLVAAAYIWQDVNDVSRTAFGPDPDDLASSIVVTRSSTSQAITVTYAGGAPDVVVHGCAAAVGDISVALSLSTVQSGEQAGVAFGPRPSDRSLPGLSRVSCSVGVTMAGGILSANFSRVSVHQTGELRSNSLRGFGTAMPIVFADPGQVNLTLGDAGNVLDVTSTGMYHSMVFGGQGTNTVRVVAAGILGVGQFLGYAGLPDMSISTLTVDASAAVTTLKGTQTDTLVTGLGMHSDLTYTEVDVLQIKLGAVRDEFTVYATHRGLTEVLGGGGNDALTAVGVSYTMASDGTNFRQGTFAGPLRLDGQDGDDFFDVGLASEGSANISVIDSGLITDANSLVIRGSTGNDTMLCRSTFIAAITPLDDTEKDPEAGQMIVDEAAIEFVFIDDSINAGVTVLLLDGDDLFVLDDSTFTLNVDGGEGADSFRIGQVYNASRSNPSLPAISQVTTTLTTRGHLSNGNGQPAILSGGRGEDTFRVYRNMGTLQLNGGAGDDVFVVQAFALAETPGVIDENLGMTTVASDEGSDTIQYTVNAPVNIDGGTGVDLLGTEFDDHFVVTSEGVFGAGLFVTFVNLERIAIETTAGRDRVIVLSTSPLVSTEIYLGLGSDTLYVMLREVTTVQSQTLRGKSAVWSSRLQESSEGQALGLISTYNGLEIEGLRADVYDDEGYDIAVRSAPYLPTLVQAGDGSTTQPTSTTYALRLSRPPPAGSFVQITIVPQTAAVQGLAMPVRIVEVSPSVINFAAGDVGPFIIEVSAPAEQYLDASYVATINHNLLHLYTSTGEELPAHEGFTDSQVESYKVRVLFAEENNVQVVQSHYGLTLVEGELEPQTYELRRLPCKPGAVALTVTMVTDDAGISVSPPSVTFRDNTLCSVTVSVTLDDNSEIEGRRLGTITHVASGPGAVSAAEADGLLLVDNVPLSLRDNDAPDVVFRLPDNGIRLLEGGAFEDGNVDNYVDVRLTAPLLAEQLVLLDFVSESTPTALVVYDANDQPETVFLDAIPHGSNSIGLRFDASSWNTFKRVRLVPLDNNRRDGGVLQSFPESSPLLANLMGPLLVEGGDNPASLSAIPPALMLPFETDAAIFIFQQSSTDLVNETLQIDQVILANTGKQGPAQGEIFSRQVTGFGMSGPRDIGGRRYPAGMRLSGTEELVLSLGPGGNDVHVHNTGADGVTRIELGDGDNSVTIDRTSNALLLLGGAGADVVSTQGDMAELTSLLVFDGESAASIGGKGGSSTDTVHLSNVGTAAITAGDPADWLRLTPSALSHSRWRAGPSRVMIVKIEADGGTFRLTLPAIDGRAGSLVTTESLRHDATADIVQRALQEAVFPSATCGARNDSRCASSFYVERLDNEFLIFYRGELKGAAGMAHGWPSLETFDLINHQPNVAAGVVEDVTEQSRGLRYTRLENVNVTMSRASQTVASLRGTSALTGLIFGNGDDDVYISSGANLTALDTINFVPGTLQAFTKALYMDLSAGSHKLVISDEEDLVGRNGKLTEDSLSGICPGPITYIIAPESAGGDLSGGVALWLGQGNDSLLVDGTLSRNATRTLTAVHAGSGADDITVLTQAGQDDLVFVAGGTGDDFLSTEGSLPALMTGGGGADRLIGSARQALLCGDECLLTFAGHNFSLSGQSILGGGPNGTVIDRQGRQSLLARMESIPVLVEVSYAAAVGSLVNSFSGRDKIFAFDDGGVILGGGDSDAIKVGNGPFIVCGDDAVVDFDIGVERGGDVLPLEMYAPQHVATLLSANASNDTIETADHPVVVFGGFGDDVIQTGAGPDLVFGDSGMAGLAQHTCGESLGICKHPRILQVLWARSTDHEDRLTNSTTRGGGDDVLLLGDGDNVAVAGGGHDTVESGQGDDQLALDHAEFFPARGHPALSSPFESATCAECGGSDWSRPGAGNDFVIGGQGEDDIEDLLGDNTLVGGHTRPGGHDGSDRIVDGSGAGVLLGDNGAVVSHNLVAQHLLPFPRDWQLRRTAVADPPQQRIRLVTLFDGHDGQGAADELLGGGGNDIMHGQRGDDYLHLGMGSDAASGGSGNNTIVGDSDGQDMVCAASCRFVWRGLAEGSATGMEQAAANDVRRFYPYVVVQQTLVTPTGAGNLSAMALEQGKTGADAATIIRDTDIMFLGGTVRREAPVAATEIPCPEVSAQPVPPTPAEVLTDSWLSEVDRMALVSEANVSDARLTVAAARITNGTATALLYADPDRSLRPNEERSVAAAATIRMEIVNGAVVTVPGDPLANAVVAASIPVDPLLSVARFTLSEQVERFLPEPNVTAASSVLPAEVLALSLSPSNAGSIQYDGQFVIVSLSADAAPGLLTVQANVSALNTTVLVAAQLAVVTSALTIRLRPFPVGDSAIPDQDSLQVLGRAPHAEAGIVLPELQLSTGGRVGVHRLPALHITAEAKTAADAAVVRAALLVDVDDAACASATSLLCRWANAVASTATLAASEAGAETARTVWHAALLPWGDTDNIKSLEPGIDAVSLNLATAAAIAARAEACNRALSHLPSFFNASVAALNASTVVQDGGSCKLCANNSCTVLAADEPIVTARHVVTAAFPGSLFQFEDQAAPNGAASRHVTLDTAPLPITAVALHFPGNLTGQIDTRRRVNAEAVFGGRTHSRWPSTLANTPPFSAMFALASDAPLVIEAVGDAVVLRGQAARAVTITLATLADVAVSVPAPVAPVPVASNLVPEWHWPLDMGELVGLPIQPVRAGEAFAVPVWQHGAAANSTAAFEFSMHYDPVVLELLELRPCSDAVALYEQAQLGAVHVDIISNVTARVGTLTPLLLAVFRGRWLGPNAASEVEAGIQLIPRRSGPMSAAANVSVLVDMAHPVPAWVGKGPAGGTADGAKANAAIRAMHSKYILARIEYDGSNTVDLSLTSTDINRTANGTVASPRGAVILGGKGADTLMGTSSDDVIAGSGAYSTGAGGALPIVRHEYVFRKRSESESDSGSGSDDHTFGEAMLREGFVGASAAGPPPLGPIAWRNESDAAMTALRPWLATQTPLALGEAQLRYGNGVDGTQDEMLDLHVVLLPNLVRQRVPFGGDGDTIHSGGGRDVVAGDDLIAVDALLPLPAAAERLGARLTAGLASLGRRLQGLSIDEGLQRLLEGAEIPPFTVKYGGNNLTIEGGTVLVATNTLAAVHALDASAAGMLGQLSTNAGLLRRMAEGEAVLFDAQAWLYALHTRLLRAMAANVAKVTRHTVSPGPRHAVNIADDRLLVIDGAEGVISADTLLVVLSPSSSNEQATSAVTLFESAAIASDAETRLIGLTTALRERAERLVPLDPISSRLLVGLPVDEPPILLLGNDQCVVANASRLLMAADSAALFVSVGGAQSTVSVDALVAQLVTVSRGERSASVGFVSTPARDMPFYDQRGGVASFWSEMPGKQASDVVRVSRVTQDMLLTANPAAFRLALDNDAQFTTRLSTSVTSALTFLRDSEGFASPPAVLDEDGADPTFSTDEVRVSVPSVGVLAAPIAVILDDDPVRDRLQISPAAAPAAAQVTAVRGSSGGNSALALAVSRAEGYAAAALAASHISQSAVGRSSPCFHAFDPVTAASASFINVLGAARCIPLCVDEQCGDQRTPVVTLFLRILPDAPAEDIVAAIDAVFASSGVAVSPGLPVFWQVHTLPRLARLVSETDGRRRTVIASLLARIARQEENDAGTAVAVALLPYGSAGQLASAADIVQALRANDVQAATGADPFYAPSGVQDDGLDDWAVSLIALAVLGIVCVLAFLAWRRHKGNWKQKIKLKRAQDAMAMETIGETTTDFRQIVNVLDLCAATHTGRSRQLDTYARWLHVGLDSAGAEDALRAHGASKGAFLVYSQSPTATRDVLCVCTDIDTFVHASLAVNTHSREVVFGGTALHARPANVDSLVGCLAEKAGASLESTLSRALCWSVAGDELTWATPVSAADAAARSATVRSAAALLGVARHDDEGRLLLPPYIFVVPGGGEDVPRLLVGMHAATLAALSSASLFALNETDDGGVDTTEFTRRISHRGSEQPEMMMGAGFDMYDNVRAGARDNLAECGQDALYDIGEADEQEGDEAVYDLGATNPAATTGGDAEDTYDLADAVTAGEELGEATYDIAKGGQYIAVVGANGAKCDESAYDVADEGMELARRVADSSDHHRRAHGAMTVDDPDDDDDDDDDDIVAYALGSEDVTVVRV